MGQEWVHPERYSVADVSMKLPLDPGSTTAPYATPSYHPSCHVIVFV